MRNNGFTLIELLVVIGLISIIGFIFADVLAQTLRGQNKVRVISQVKQNGQVVMEKITGDIRGADKVVCVGHYADTTPTTLNNTLVVFKQGNFVRYRFFPPTSSSNGYIASDTFNIGDYDASNTPDRYCNTNPLFSRTLNFITDTDSVNGVSVDYDPSSPIFSLINPAQAAGFSDTVTITFRGFPGVQGGVTYENMVKEGGVLFSTSVSTGGK